MEFEIDVSGNDILSKDYTICVANKDSIIKGYKFNEKILNELSLRYNQGLYRYPKSKKGKASFKIRLYCIIVYYILKSIELKNEISLNICRDFSGREDDIKKTLKFFVEEKLNLILRDRIYFIKLSPDSNAHHYSYLMRHDNKNQMKNYVNITLEEIEIYLKKVPKDTTRASQP